MREWLLLVGLVSVGSAHAAAERMAVGAISRDGQITLTPGFSPDGLTAYFAQSPCAVIGDCPQRMTVAKKVGGRWQPGAPFPLPGDGPTVNGSPSRVDYPSVSPDGRYLLWSWSVARADKAMLQANEDFDLYRLDLATPGAVPEPLDMADINRPRAGAIAKVRFVHNETAPVMSAAGDLYFWTERPDGLGDRDVFLAPADGRGGFKRARPLPGPVNTPGSETSGWVSADGRVLLLALAGRSGSGGTDLFVSYFDNSAWSEPLNLGPAVNTPAQEFGATITPDGASLVFSSTRAYPGQAAGLIQVWTVPVSEVPVLGGLSCRSFDAACPTDAPKKAKKGPESE